MSYTCTCTGKSLMKNAGLCIAALKTSFYTNFYVVFKINVVWCLMTAPLFDFLLVTCLCKTLCIQITRFKLHQCFALTNDYLLAVVSDVGGSFINETPPTTPTWYLSRLTPSIHPYAVSPDLLNLWLDSMFISPLELSWDIRWCTTATQLDVLGSIKVQRTHTLAEVMFTNSYSMENVWFPIPANIVIFTPRACARGKVIGSVYLSLSLLSTENKNISTFTTPSKSRMAHNCQNQQKSNISVLVPASHDPQVWRIMIFVHHTYWGYSAMHYDCACPSSV